jgi:hypothetical protein
VDFNVNTTALSSDIDALFSDRYTPYEVLPGSLKPSSFVTVDPYGEQLILPTLEWLVFFSLFYDKVQCRSTISATSREKRAAKNSLDSPSPICTAPLAQSHFHSPTCAVLLAQSHFHSPTSTVPLAQSHLRSPTCAVPLSQSHLSCPPCAGGRGSRVRPPRG